MRSVDLATAFRRDYKREMKGVHRKILDVALTPILESLASDKALDTRLRDHPLSGDWQGYRECHIRPDLLLIYRKVGDDLLYIARLGSHSELCEHSTA